MLIDGAKAKAAREHKGKKIAEVAVAIDMSAPWLYALEGGKKPVDMKAPTAHALARVLGVKVGELLYQPATAECAASTEREEV